MQYYSSLKLTYPPKIGGWETILSFWKGGLFSGANGSRVVVLLSVRPRKNSSTIPLKRIKKVDDYHWGRLVLELNAVGMRHAGYNVKEEVGEWALKKKHLGSGWGLFELLQLSGMSWNTHLRLFGEIRPSNEIAFNKIGFPKNQKDVTSAKD